MTSPPEKAGPSLALLGMPALGLALSLTTLSVLVPLMLQPLTTSGLVIGAVVGGEGLLALVLPLWIGPRSDRTHTRLLGGRLPYVAVGSVLCCASLLALPWVTTLWGISSLVLVFYTGYFTFYPAYRALYPDLVAPTRMARSQGIQTLFREIGLGLALTAGPLMFVARAPLPFVLCAVVLGTLSLVFVLRVRRYGFPPPHAASKRTSVRRLLGSNGPLGRLLLANALWEFAISGLKSFIVLFVVVGMHRSAVLASVLMGIVAVVAVIAAPIAGILGERWGTVRVMRISLSVFALGLVLPAFTQSLIVLLPAMPLIGFGGAVAMTLPYAIMTDHFAEQSHGAGAGLYEFSRGLGALLGPVVTGLGIDLARPYMTNTQGYGSMWVVMALAISLSLPLLPRAPRSDPRPSRNPSGPRPTPKTADLPGL